ncbi:phage integrase family protein [Winogradskyella psychrotolerans RS-3]|uniref:Phage integrase family protein n=1 Tax=Winogradskyella psychrotolerans RS-3 TaxID=641526 RepID=S7VVM8_9FLAO|nr:phage integrase SAM-like domain-containing protein [Winogradskyella psychrotolerans]EPR73447.1 phage integrase family protein [Winogradskyella psychrotolerans RS-3]
MIKTFFYLKTDKQNNKGESPIYAKIQLQGKTTTLSTGKFIKKERWDFTNKLRNKLRLNSEKNCKLAIDLVEQKIEDAYFVLSRNSKDVTLCEVKNKLNGKTAKLGDLDVIKLFEKHNDYFKKKFETGERSKASLQKYNRAKDLLANYIRTKHGKTSFSINNIDNQFIYNLESYLKYESSFNYKVGISHNSVVKYFQCFKTVCFYGIKRNLITTNPFLTYDEKLVKKEAVFLTKAELERIEAKEFSTDRLNRVKDIFLFLVILVMHL